MEIFILFLLFAPLVFILWVANLADRRRIEGSASPQQALTWLAYGALVALYGVLAGLGLMFQLLAWLSQGPLAAELSHDLRAGGLDPALLPRIGMALWLPALLGVLLLLRPVRYLCGRLIPTFNPASTVHGVALSYISLVLMNLLFTLGLGLDNLAEMLEANEAAGMAFDPASSIWAQDLLLAVMALVGVGWLARRGLGAALKRLGVVLPTARQVMLGLGSGLLLVPSVLLLEQAANAAGLNSDPGVERLTEEMIGPLVSSALGILTLGLAAALGEESLFRGALQPRFGLLLTTILFALLHSNYGITLSTLLVFVVGLALGLLRLRANTSTAMLAHAIYNMALGLITHWGWLENF
jgi:membrane protease YdiL (CAAX protease family)